MNRRTFTQVLAATALGAAVASPLATAASGFARRTPPPRRTPFPLSVMLWTVFTRSAL